MKRIALFSLTSVLILGALGTVHEARDISSIAKFRVTTGGNSTAAASKYNNSNTVINLQNTKGGKYVRVRNHNATNGKDVGGTSLWTATRQAFTDNSGAGGKYYLKLSNTKSGQSNFTVDGSWSPDSY